MCRLSKYGPSVTFILLFVCSFAVENPFLELSQKILQIYEDPHNSKTEELMDAANEYLCKLVELRMEVTINRTEGVNLLKEVYLEGNPPFHLRNVPWDKFIKSFNWTASKVTKYEDVISDTRRIWGECLDELEKHKDPDVIL